MRRRLQLRNAHRWVYCTPLYLLPVALLLTAREQEDETTALSSQIIDQMRLTRAMGSLLSSGLTCWESALGLGSPVICF